MQKPFDTSCDDRALIRIAGEQSLRGLELLPASEACRTAFVFCPLSKAGEEHFSIMVARKANHEAVSFSFRVVGSACTEPTNYPPLKLENFSFERSSEKWQVIDFSRLSRRNAEQNREPQVLSTSWEDPRDAVGVFAAGELDSPELSILIGPGPTKVSISMLELTPNLYYVFEVAEQDGAAKHVATFPHRLLAIAELKQILAASLGGCPMIAIADLDPHTDWDCEIEAVEGI